MQQIYEIYANKKLQIATHWKKEFFIHEKWRKRKEEKSQIEMLSSVIEKEKEIKRN